MIRVVVADDHPIVRSGIVALLQSAQDVEVVGEATTGIEAVELAERLTPTWCSWICGCPASRAMRRPRAS